MGSTQRSSFAKAWPGLTPSFLCSLYAKQNNTKQTKNPGPALKEITVRETNSNKLIIKYPPIKYLKGCFETLNMGGGREIFSLRS